jgi:hypothetical protein
VVGTNFLNKINLSLATEVPIPDMTHTSKEMNKKLLRKYPPVMLC